MRYPAATVAGALLIGLLVLGCTGQTPEDGNRQQKSPSLETRSASAERPDKIEVTGELRARSNASVGPPPIQRLWDFKISQLAPEGSQVDEGDVVLGFDPSQLQERLSRAIADRDSAETTLEKTRTDLEIERRKQELRLSEARAKQRKSKLKVDVPDQVVARNELEQHRIDLELADAEVEYLIGSLQQLDKRADAELTALEALARRGRSEVTIFEESIAKMNVTAPRAGTVLYKQNWRGEKKKIGDRCWRNETVIQIPDLNTLMATAEVDEAEAARLEVGQRVEFQLDSLRGKTWSARVSRVGRSVHQRSWRDPRRIVEIDLELERSDPERMRPGMRFVGELDLSSGAESGTTKGTDNDLAAATGS